MSGKTLVELEESMHQLKLEFFKALWPILGPLFKLFLWVKDVWRRGRH